jgi:hypothetical protein
VSGLDRYASAYRHGSGAIEVAFGSDRDSGGRFIALSARHAIDFCDFYARGADYATARDEADAQANMRVQAGWAA